jgi:ubiquinone/menaquinone biosynthesis C-methylase UbiE
VVGGPGGPGAVSARLAGAARLTSGTRAAYDAAASGWDAGPGPMYRALATALVAHAGRPVAGQRLLDLGAGTGAAGAAALAAGAEHVVAADLAPAMLTHGAAGLAPVAADAAALPFPDHTFALTLAAFCVGHLPDVAASLAEVRRVSAALAVSSFAPGWTHPAKSAVDGVLAESGYQPPDWYRTFKEETEPRAQDPAWLRGQLAAAGFTDVTVRTLSVGTPIGTPAQLAAWRLGMAHVAPFVAALPPGSRAALLRAAETAVTRAGGPPLTVSMLLLTAA